MNIRVLAFARYGRSGASTRLRTLQYLPELRESGIDIDVTTLFPDEYLQVRFRSRGTAMLWAARGFVRRFCALFRARRYDVLWVEYELFPYFPAWFERGLGWLGVRLVVDYDDAIFHRYDAHASWAVRKLLGKKIDSVMRLADVVVAGNPYLARRARDAGARDVVIVPTTVDLRRYSSRSEGSGGVTVGWIGSPSTAKYLDTVRDVLAMVQERFGARILVVGAGPLGWTAPVIESVAWAEEQEVAAIKRMDIGIMPLVDGPFERGKCGYKLIQYMACGIPVVATPIGVNADIVDHGVNGFLAEDSDAWQAALSQLIANPNLRASMGAAARRTVEERYAMLSTAPIIAKVLRRAAS